ncbi:uncharacterized protein IWZ02DRAFT_456397 [Phyllosticta citriasiana]|uniref:uncharacterized protein n=1 Tax=Phyllosticta citriasiana TaxID=595635 RepID=UPI0030FDD04F
MDEQACRWCVIGAFRAMLLRHHDPHAAINNSYGQRQHQQRHWQLRARSVVMVTAAAVVVVGLTAYILVHNYHIVHTRVVSCKSRITVTRQRRTHTLTHTYTIPALPTHRPPSMSLVHYYHHHRHHHHNHHHSFSHQTSYIAQLATCRKKGATIQRCKSKVELQSTVPLIRAIGPQKCHASAAAAAAAAHLSALSVAAYGRSSSSVYVEMRWGREIDP